MPVYTQTIGAGVDTVFWQRSGNFVSDTLASGYWQGGVIWESCLHFSSVPIRREAIIVSATLAINVSEIIGGTPTLKVHGEDADNPATVASRASGEARVRTTAYTTWSPPSTGEKTIDIKTAIQEIVDRAGWSYGNALNILIDNSFTGNPTRLVKAESYATYDRTLTITTYGPPQIQIF